MKTKENKGVTLIALAVTIIVMLILAGVTVSTLTGNSGITEKAQTAKKMSKVSSEKEAIQLALSLAKMENYLDESNEYYIGTPLYNKTLENGKKWDIIILDDTLEKYGTDWCFVEKGTEIPKYGKTQYEWLVNYETGEFKQLEEKYTELSYKSSLAVTDGLIFNMDSAIIDTNNQDELKENSKEILGENVELVNFNWNEESGMTTKSFNLDGIDDYIKIKYSTEDEKTKLAQNGFSFEFYGKVNQGKSYYNNKVVNSSYTGIFCYWNGVEQNQAQFRFGIQNQKYIKWNAGFYNTTSDYSENGAAWNIWYPIDNLINQDIYYTITLDANNIVKKDQKEYYKGTLYIDGNKKYEGLYDKRKWDYFASKVLNQLNYFCIGRSSMSNDGMWHYSKLNTYTLRLYNRALSEEEIKENNNLSVKYHELLK